MTTKLPARYYLPLWEQAAAEEIGLHITVHREHQPLLVNALYACRQETGGFEELMIFQPQPPGTIYIAKKSVELPE
jgi:hypothetical protein